MNARKRAPLRHVPDMVWLRCIARLLCRLAALWLLVGIVRSDVVRPVEAQVSGALRAEDADLVNVEGNRVILTGINWFGLETESFAPHGLWARNWEDILDQVQELGFNTIRLPYSNALFDAGSVPNSVNYDLNPDLEGLSGLEIMDKVVEGAGERGIKIILDRHRPGASAQSELWYTAHYDEQRWIDDWVMLAERYEGDGTVIGADLHNEPHGPATWGTGEEATDWRLAAERAGNAILAANPDWLIIVQGIERYEQAWYWWGGNLIGAREHPVRLDHPDKLVYSAHVYGPGVYPQPWFDVPEFPDNLAQIWDEHWGYLAREGIAPVIIGEFGGRSVGEDKEGIWQRELVSYLREHNLSYFYWTLNPNSGDTGGLLLDDWESVDPDKQELLSGYQFPPLGGEGVPLSEATPVADEPSGDGDNAAPGPTDVPPTAPPVSPEALQVRFRMPHAEEGGVDAKPEFVIVNRGSSPVSLSRVEITYWLGGADSFDAEDGDLVFRCDWAAVDCRNVVGTFGQSGNGAPYLRLSFHTAAGAIASGEDSGEIKVRFNRSDWAPVAQEAHDSFGPFAEYVAWERVTLHVDGQLVWGVAPANANATEGRVTGEATDMAPTVPSATGTPTPEGLSVQIVTVTPETGATAAPVMPGTVAPATPFVLPGIGGAASAGALFIIAAACAAVALIALGVLVGMFLTRRGD